MILTFIVNATYNLINLFKSLGFRKAAKNTALIQKKILLKLIKENAHTKYGQEFNFSSITSIADFQKRVPIISYQDLLPYIEELKLGKRNVLTKEKIDRFVLSSGTAEATKLIPYDKTLRKQFGKSLAPWLNNIFRKYPAVLFGPSFWIVTPPGEVPAIKSKIPAGFDEDSSYFGFVERFFVQQIMVVPDEVSQLRNLQNYYYALSYFLLIEKNLRLISVWNPSILTIILDFIRHNSGSLVTDIRNGTLSFPSSEDDSIRKVLKKHLRPKRLRAFEFATALEDFDGKNWTLIWPKLTLISCWTHAWAKDLISGLEILFPGVTIQGKGLLATEAFISFPFETAFDSAEEEMPVLAVSSHFFEFLDTTTNKMKLACELEEDKQYEVIVTTGGGLYRYKMNDIVKVCGYYHSVPRIEFIGKTDVVSDICGEKLHETHVSDALKESFKFFGVECNFYFLAPGKCNSSPCYVLFLEEEGIDKSNTILLKLVEILDVALKENFHYKKCRELGQLHKPEIFILKPEAINTYLSIKAKNSKISTQKLIKLEKEYNWDKKLEGYYIESSMMIR